MIATAWLVVIIAIVFVTATEALSYVLVYRTDDYQTTKAELERQAKRLAKAREEGAGAVKSKKQHAQAEESLKTMHREITTMQMKSTVIVSGLFIFLMWYFHSAFAGVVVARLPFEPLGLIQGLSHRGIEGEDVREASFVFLYGMTTMAIRTILKKVTGSQLSREAAKLSSFGPSA